MLRLGLSTCYFKEKTPEEWASVREAGITDMEISMNCPLEEYLEKGEPLAADLRAAGLNIWSIHIPFGRSFDLTDPDPAHFAEIEYRYKTLIDAGARWGAKVITTHASTEPFPQEQREARMERGKYLYRMLGEYAAARGMKLTVEVLPRTCMGNCSAECMDFTDGEVSFINFDVNHLLRESHADFIRNAGSRIITTHLSDYDFIDERHWVPGDGKIDWREFYTLMEEAGYEGPYLFELGESISGQKLTPAALAARFRSVIGYED